MAVFILTFGLLMLVVGAMAVGVIVQKKSMASSCGGLGAMGIDKVCDCDDPCEARRERMAKERRWNKDRIL